MLILCSGCCNYLVRGSARLNDEGISGRSALAAFSVFGMIGAADLPIVTLAQMGIDGDLKLQNKGV